jgi:Glycine-zipper domain
MSALLRFAAIAAPMALAACAASPPPGPSVLALPRQGEDFGQFQAQDINCRNFASGQVGFATPSDAATSSAIGSAAVGTALGAAAGAAIGSVSGNLGAGAAIGGASGLLLGSAVGANNAQVSSAGLQQRYDMAYTQCMVASGYSVQQPSFATPVYAASPWAVGPSVSVGVGTGWGWGRRGYW